MAWFTVQYRDKNGEKAEVELEAADRTSLFKLLSEKHISAINIRQRDCQQNATLIKGGRLSHLLLSVGVIIFVLSITALCFILFRGDDRKRDDSPLPKIAKTRQVNQNRVVTTSRNEGAEKKQEESVAATKTWPPPEAYQDARGIWRYPGGARVFDPRDRERAIKIPEGTELPKFKYQIERELATLLTLEPGGLLVGEPQYGRYQQDFVNSLLDKIEISDEDSDRDKEIKMAVIEAKKELSSRIKNGEDIVQILKETREELQRLNKYKREIEDIVREQVRNSENSDDDLSLVIEAANKMFEEKGVAPMRANALLRRRHDLLLREARKNQSETE